MSWYYSVATGLIEEETGLDKFITDREVDREKLAAKFGVPQLLYGPFATREQAQAFKDGHPDLADTVHQDVNKATGAVQNAIQGPVRDVTSAIAAFGNQLVKVAIRLAEAAVGIVLLAIAANAILKQTTGVDVGGTVARAGRKAAGAAAAV